MFLSRRTNANKLIFFLQWGEDLKREHERYLVKYNNDIPVFVTDFPAAIKPFYARDNDDTQTVSILLQHTVHDILVFMNFIGKGES